jgi:nitronate monooxygenase
MLQTRFTERFGVAHPILQAPLGGATDARLAAAVSDGGALGTFQAAHPRNDDDWFAAQLAAVRELTTKPFGVGFVTNFVPFQPKRFEMTLDAQVPVIAFSFGDPHDYIERAHASGAKAIYQVQTLDGARAAVDAGADAIAAQGMEAGGHTGNMGLLPLLGAVLDAVDVPVLAAGGVANGRTLAAVLAMGADGAWIGSAFMATPEAPLADPRIADLIVASDGSDTVLTHAYDILDNRPWPPGTNDRVHANKFTERWAGRDEELRRQREKVDRPMEFDVDEIDVRYGQSAAFVSAVRPAAQVVADIVEDAERRLAQWR